MTDETKVKEQYAGYSSNVVPVRGKHQWKIVFFGPPYNKHPRTLGRGCSIQKAWASALARQTK